MGAFYRPPKNMNCLKNCLTSVTNVCNIGDICLIGDFNTHIEWQECDSGICKDNIDSFVFDNFVTALKLKQFCFSPARDANTLDLVFSSLDDVQATTTRNLLRSDHDSIDVSFCIPSHLMRQQTLSRLPPSRATPNWKRVNWELIVSAVNDLDWHTLTHVTPEQSMTTIVQWLVNIISEKVPHSVSKTNKFPVWYTEERKLALKINTVRGVYINLTQTLTQKIPLFFWEHMRID